MKERILQLAKNFSISATDYAGQGNAILGIRDSGKTYTGTKAAEGLLDAGIPIIVYDPIGIWKNLKIGTGKHKGYPIVVAGGDGSDIKLTAINAVEIVRAAMKENVSLVIDLYSPELANKSTWIRIVQETVDELMYKNKAFGMRHVFIEEAAEFIPQRLQPQHSKVYAALERLARMGRNAHLGMTIINQRAEEVNKAILGIMALSLLHKQVGKNSLLSIKKWLEIRGISNESIGVIMKDLPTLKKGECYVISDDHPKFIKVLEKNTFHPDPKKPVDPVISKLAINVTAFVDRMNQQLQKKELPKDPAKLPSKAIVTNPGQASKIEQQYKESQIRNGELLNQLKQKDTVIANQKRAIDILEKRMTDYSQRLMTIAEKLTDSHGMKITEVTSTKVLNNSTSVPKIETSVNKRPLIISTNNGVTGGGAMRMLKAAAMYYPNEITVQRMAALAGMSAGSGTFGIYFRSLKRDSLISAQGKIVKATEEGLQKAGDVEPIPTDPQALLEMWCNNVGNDSGMGKILRVLFENYPNSMTSDELGEATGMSPGSGTFGVYQRKLRRLGLIELSAGQYKAAAELFN